MGLPVALPLRITTALLCTKLYEGADRKEVRARRRPTVAAKGP
jgi:hypothetical protein